jgi:hypothetical protein
MLGRIVKPWPGLHGKYAISPAKQLRNGVVPGSLIEVDGPWEPDNSWTCGTDVVWRVVDSRVPSPIVYLCKHQITFEIDGEGEQAAIAAEAEVSA